MASKIDQKLQFKPGFKPGRCRSVNFTTGEIEVLVNLVIKYKHIIENKRCDSAMWRAKDAAWVKIADELNQIEGHEKRTPGSIRSKYEALKKNAKKERTLGFDARVSSVPKSVREKIWQLQECSLECPVNESVVLAHGEEVLDKQKRAVPHETELKKEVDLDAWSNGNSGDHRTIESEEQEELATRLRLWEKKAIDEEMEMKRIQHEMKMDILRLKYKNEMKAADLRMKSLKADYELKRRKLDFYFGTDGDSVESD